MRVYGICGMNTVLKCCRKQGQSIAWGKQICYEKKHKDTEKGGVQDGDR